MDSIEHNLKIWHSSLVESLPLGDIYLRSAVVYKRKAPLRCWALREAAFWRVTDLLTQSFTLHQQGHGLGARILLRSAFETLAMLIYLNQLIQQVVNGELDYQLFSDKTSILLLGSRNESTEHKSLNIVTILSKCDKKYPGIGKWYSDLSEAAHPNFDGMVTGYSKIDHANYVTQFFNRWMELHGATHLTSMDACMKTFQHEYDVVWPDRMESLEDWITSNDEILGATNPPSAQA